MLLELSSLDLFNWSLTQEDVVGCITDSVESGKYNLINFTAIQVRYNNNNNNDRLTAFYPGQPG